MENNNKLILFIFWMLKIHVSIMSGVSVMLLFAYLGSAFIEYENDFLFLGELFGIVASSLAGLGLGKVKILKIVEV